MKRKIACIFMALALVIGLLPMGAVHTNAASYLNPSENVVNLIKQFEGFSASAYWDVSQWTVGYGTTGYAGQTITEAAADQALRTQVAAISERVNQFTAANNLYLTQNKHDALISFCFNCGTDWMTQGGRFYEAVVRNADVNSFLFAISLWANIGSAPDANLLNRRMSEANLYLNGVYSKAAPAAYTYTIFDANGGVAGNGGEDKMQGFLSGSNVNILVANPTRTGATFGGWYTAPSGGTGVKYLSASTAGRTLYAQYGVPASVVGTYANVRNGAGTNYTQIGTVNGGTQIVIVETAQVNGSMWGRFSDGWIALEYTNYNGITIPVTNTNTNTGYVNPINSGMVIATTGVNIRAGAGTNYASVGSAVNGQTVSIYEITSVNGVNWGRIGDNRWICLSYVRLNNPITSTTTTTTTTTTTPGVIWEGTTNNTTAAYQLGTVNTNGLNIRAAAGVGNAVIGSLNKGAQVKVYSQTMVGNVPWGRIDQGWVCMNYVTLAVQVPTTGTTTGTTTGAAIATGTVNAGAYLNVRSGAGVNAPLVNRLNPGTVISIYEKVSVNGAEWGRIGTNQWVCLSYVTLNNTIVVPGTTVVTPVVTPSATGTGVVISTTALNVRSGAGANFAKVSSLNPGTTVNILEVVTSGSQQWGRIGTNQWVCMTYVRMNNTGTTVTPGTTQNTPSTYTGTVKSTTALNVRAAAGTGNAIVGKLNPGTAVTIFEITSVNGVNWGRISSGWICMNYIQLSNASAVIWH